MIEAMACGTPVIAYRNGAVPEVIEEGHTGFIKWNQIGNIEPPMQGRHVRHALTPAQREMQVIDVKMDDIEFRGALKDMLEHQYLIRHLVCAVLVQPQGAPARSDQSGRRLGVPTGKERYFVTLPHQFLREMRHDPFRPAVLFWRDTFKKRRHLSNSHGNSLPSLDLELFKFFGPT